MASPVMFYLLLGSVGLSLGATLFLFREVRRLSDSASASKKQQEEAAKTLRELGEQLRELAKSVGTSVPVVEEELPKPEGARKPKVLEGGPKDYPSVTKEVAKEEATEEVVEESDSSCDDEDGVCKVRK